SRDRRARRMWPRWGPRWSAAIPRRPGAGSRPPRTARRPRGGDGRASRARKTALARRPRTRGKGVPPPGSCRLLRRLRLQPAVALLLELEGQKLVAGADDPPLHQDVHHVGDDVVEEAL